MAAPVKKGDNGNGPPSPAASRVSQTSMSPELLEIARRVARIQPESPAEASRKRFREREAEGAAASAAAGPSGEERRIASAPILRAIPLSELLPEAHYNRDSAAGTVTIFLTFSTPEIATRCKRELVLPSATMEVPESDPVCIHVTVAEKDLRSTLEELFRAFPKLEPEDLTEQKERT